MLADPGQVDGLAIIKVAIVLLRYESKTRETISNSYLRIFLSIAHIMNVQTVPRGQRHREGVVGT
jgi:hypothetical protein